MSSTPSPPAQERPPVDEEPTPAPESFAAEVSRQAQAVWRGFRRLGPAGPLAVVAASTPALAGVAVIGLMSRIAPWLQAHPLEGFLSYVGAFTVLGGLALMPTYAYAVMGGWAFGLRLGLAAMMTAIAGASTVAYVIGRLASGDRVVQLLEEHEKSRAVYNALLRSGSWKSLLIVTLIRIPPNSPFAITNLALSAARVHPVAYLAGTLLGISPRTGFAVFLGAGLSQLSFEKPHQTWLFVGGLAATLVVLVILGYLGNKAIAQVTGAGKARGGRCPQPNLRSEIRDGGAEI